MDSLALPLSALNKLASMAEGSLRVSCYEAHVRRDILSEVKLLINQFGSYKDANNKRPLIRIDKEKRELVFASEKARFFINGGWLEDHVVGLIHKIKPELDAIQKRNPDDNIIQDFGRNLKIVRKNKSGLVENELDLSFLADNKLHIIECKTMRFDAYGGEDSAGAEIMYKLNSLRDHTGSLQAKVMLVSYKPLKPEHICRANDLGIEVCAGKEIQTLETRLKRWIEE